MISNSASARSREAENNTEMSLLAQEAAGGLREVPGIDGVVVILLRREPDSFAVAVNAPDISMDTTIACVVHALGTLRAKNIDAMKAAGTIEAAPALKEGEAS